MVAGQYDIFENADPGSRRLAPYLVVIQSNLLSELRTVLVAPLVAVTSRVSAAKLYPQVTIGDTTFYASMPEMAPYDRRKLTKLIGNCASQHTDFVAAIDLIFTGF